ncbi:DUF6033 family protein [Butyrivibrio sp. MC2013]|uniref:DUF6033 family protein n=1 Tax=Butyrivibrio sp. MC2013 TaxID=1280686 RepID=UPI0003FF180D|nr:DUF6033 family protein [Butyrivibrio sp. MC2013]
MSSIQGLSAYQQTGRSWQAGSTGKAGSTAASSKAAETASKTAVETKPWTPLDSASSLVPRQTEYGNTIGDVQLSDKAKSYYEQLKSKYHNLEFIAVSGAVKDQVQKNAASYGNANKMVVLIDEEKLEKMATDEAFRKKYEGIIAMSSAKISQLGKSLQGSGSPVTNFGMSVGSDGRESFFATVDKSFEAQNKMAEKRAAKKKEEKAKEKKLEEKKTAEKRLEKAKEKKAGEAGEADDDTKAEGVAEEREYGIIEAGSVDELLSKVQTYSYNNSMNHVMADSERMLGGHVDFKG